MARYGPRPSSPADRFWKHIAAGDPDACWEWQGSRHRLGYGVLWGGERYRTKWAKAHRVSWEIHHGEIPDSKHVLHHCDNPPCCNPAHLHLGGPAENAQDRASRKRGRESRERGEAHPHAKLTEAQVRAIVRELQRLPRRSQQSIADEFGISQPQVSAIMRRKSWAHLWQEVGGIGGD
jgi:hypothetical protein